ncbi:MAG TPA: hypothetical protein VMG12_31845 [Polyangiaceae bacterium]|nr:hypothetical protein [Polyangiaceae bacterium]
MKKDTFGCGFSLVVALLAGACSGDAEPSALGEPSPALAPLMRSSAALERPPRGASPPPTDPAFVAFESGQVRPLALSPDGRTLYATNTPDNRLEIFEVGRGDARPVGSVVVGLEPVSVALARDGEVWVVNHLSDSVSIVDVSNPHQARVVRTLLVGDEPRDIVFAGTKRSRAFITAAHRGQNSSRSPQLTTPGVGRADVWVFDRNALGNSLGGDPLAVVTLFADTPRALAVTPDGATVYAAAFASGNRTTTVPAGVVAHNGGLPPPATNGEGMPGPVNGLIVKFRPDASDAGQLHWLDRIGRRWDDFVKLRLPDRDVFAIDARATPPAPIDGGAFSEAGTILFNLAVNPKSGRVYVSNLDARNDVRFEGHNVTGPAQGAPDESVRGHLAESRITVIDPAKRTVKPRHLNKHIDYSQAGTPSEVAKSLATPMQMVVTGDGKFLYVAAQGSAKVGIFPTAALENDTFVPSSAAQIELSAGGPTGLVFDEPTQTLYALTRFDNGISVVDAKKRREIAHFQMPNPEPQSLVQGRRFLYDAALTSSHGDSACATCHVFGDLDALAWDLGDPDGIVTPVPGPFIPDLSVIEAAFGELPIVHHPLKGPMSTQSLRGMANHGAMHWRGDRTGGTDATRLQVLPSEQPDTGSFDELAAFTKFNVAFEGLLGRERPLEAGEMQQFAEFALQLTYPPNPIRNLDNSLTADQRAGRDFFMRRAPDGTPLPSDSFTHCVGCHVLDPEGNAEFGVDRPGFFGTDGSYTFALQFMKIPHLRNLYQKVGMFGRAPDLDPMLGGFLPPPFNPDSVVSDQVRGFGFLHDGSVDTVFRFHGRFQFQQSATNPGGFPFPDETTPPAEAAALIEENIRLRRQVEAFLLAFDSNLAPVVGQQLTLRGGDPGAALTRLDLLEARAAVGECDLIVKGRARGRVEGHLYDPSTQSYLPDQEDEPAVTRQQLRASARARQELTFTAVPPGSGLRMGLDRDFDGTFDGDE